MDIWTGTDGPRNAECLLVGEAWGADEQRLGRPFVGFSGKELDKMLHEAGLSRQSVLCTNVVSDRPFGNEFSSWLDPTPRKKAEKEAGEFFGLYPQSKVIEGVNRLHQLVETLKPKLIIAAGNFPLWALGDNHASITTVQGKKLPAGITKWRGSQTWTRPIGGICYPLLPLIHPAAILRNWSQRTVTVHDLRARAGRFLKGQLSWDPPNQTMIPKPNLQEALDFIRMVAHDMNRGPVSIAVDIETWQRRYITCIGLAIKDTAICIPLFYLDKSGTVDYFTKDEEVTILNNIRGLLHHPNCHIIGQNFMYDTQYFYRSYGINAKVNLDTMVAHHLLWPGTPKSLDYLASLYCNYYCYWKDESEEWATDLNPEALWTYNCKDTLATFEIGMLLKDLLVRIGKDQLYVHQLEQWDLARSMMLRGTRLNPDLKRQYSMDLWQSAEEISAWLLEVMPKDLRYAPSGKPWYNSPTFAMQIFYDQLKIPPTLNRKTKRPSLDAESLPVLKSREPLLGPIFDKMSELRSLQVFQSHFLDISLPPFPRMTCNYNISGTDTFRWSSSANGFGEGTNLQNIPKGDEDD